MIRNYLFNILSIIFITINSAFTSQILDLESIPHVKAFFNNVGGGNSTTFAFHTPNQKKRYMIIDCGSKGFKNDLKYAEAEQSLNEQNLTSKLMPLINKDQSLIINNLILPSKTSPSDPFCSPPSKQQINNPKILESIMKGRDRNFYKVLDEIDEGDVAKAIDLIRKSLGGGLKKELSQETRGISLRSGSILNLQETKIPIEVQLVVISHPDEDHYKWLPELFSEKNDIIRTIVLGGLPESYNDTFKAFLLQCFLEHETKIYFPTISFDALTTFSDSDFYLGTNVTRESWALTNSYAPHTWSDALNGKIDANTRKLLFGGALNFGEHFQIHFLSINSIHQLRKRIDPITKNKTKKIIRLSDIKDKNCDSLVVRVAISPSIENSKQASCLIMGDAINQNTVQIHENYFDHPEIIESTCYSASHHGSHTKGSNNLSWLQAVKPQYIIFSNGKQYGHPTEELYEICNKLDTLQTVQKHTLRWGPEKPEAQGVHSSTRGMFSTFDSGTLVATLIPNELIKIEPIKWSIINSTQASSSSSSSVSMKKRFTQENSEIKSDESNKKQRSDTLSSSSTDLDDEKKEAFSPDE